MNDASVMAATIGMIRDQLDTEMASIEEKLIDPESNLRERHPGWRQVIDCGDEDCDSDAHPEHWEECEADAFSLLDGLDSLRLMLWRYEQRLAGRDADADLVTTAPD